jgi:hypothetical protein
VCDVRRDRADTAATKHGIPAFYDAAKMLAELKPDVVSITTGGHEYGSDHFEPTMQALDAGCHVLGEKPISNEIPKAEQMVAKAREKERVLRHQSQPPLHGRRAAGEEVGQRGPTRAPAVLQHEHVDQESGREFAVVSDQGAAPAHDRRNALFLRRRRSRAMLRDQGAGPQIWSTAHFNLKFKNGAVGGLSGSYDIERGHPWNAAKSPARAGDSSSKTCGAS